MKRSTPPKRYTRVRPVNPERRARRNAITFGERAAAVRELPCLVRGCPRQNIQAAHVRSRGAGGTRRDLVPLCDHHHREQHAVGIKTFAVKHGIDLRAEADRIAQELDRRGYA